MRVVRTHGADRKVASTQQFGFSGPTTEGRASPVSLDHLRTRLEQTTGGGSPHPVTIDSRAENGLFEEGLARSVPAEREEPPRKGNPC